MKWRSKEFKREIKHLEFNLSKLKDVEKINEEKFDKLGKVVWYWKY